MESSIITEHDINSTNRTLWLKALSALELKNLEYAIDLLANVVRSKQDLTPEVGFVDGVEVVQDNAADAAGGQVVCRGATNAADTDQQCAGFRNPPLAGLTNLRQCEMTRVSAH